MNLFRSCSGLLLVATLGFSPMCQGQGRFHFDTTPGNLSKQVVPSRYALLLNLDPARDTFTGDVSITLKVRQAAPFIELDAFELSAISAQLVGLASVRPLQVTPMPDTQSWKLAPVDGSPIAAGEYRLQIEYAGKVNLSGEGLFVAPYETDGKKERMLATQLEAISARTVFPSFDEPSFRAVFEITVRAPKEFQVISNMPLARLSVQGETATHRFAPTPPMPSYLVSVATGHFDVLHGRAAGIPLRIFTAPGKRDEARYAMQVTAQVLPYYTQYFGVPFALPKLDQLAVPSVRQGAMEDWGLISYAEDTVLMDAARSSPFTRRVVYSVPAHEIAHQWFGNLVTAASWEEIWLNEAFATWLENKTTNHFNPQWKVFLEGRVQIDRALAIDAGAGTRAIRSGPVREAAVADVFDPITYEKGGAVLAMLEEWIGPTDFRRGLVAYMKGQRLSNATAADLWHYIGQASRRDVAGVASSWTDQKGFPLVQASTRCEAGRQTLTLAQSRFQYNGSAGGEQLWKIPVRYARGKNVATVLLDTAQRSIDLGACDDATVIVNAGGAGFYRVAYDAAALGLLTQRFDKLPEADRIMLLSDTFALMQAGKVPLSSYLSLLEALPRVTDPSRTMLWSLAKSQLAFLDAAMAGTLAQQQVRSIGRKLLVPLLAQLTWSASPKEDARTAELRGTAIEMLARFDDAPTIVAATRAFDDDDAGIKKLPPALRAPVTIAMGTHADQAHFDRLMAKLKAAQGEEERWLYVSALAAGRDAQRANDLLAASLAGVAPANVSARIPGLVARDSPFGAAAYAYARDHWDAFATLAGNWGKASVLPRATAGLNDRAQADQLLEDQRRHVGADGDVAAAREAENIRLRAAVKTREAAGLEKSLAD